MTKQYKAIVGGMRGAKAVSVDDVDNFLDWLIDQGDGSTPDDLYKAVAWTFWAVNRRANAVAGMPYLVFPMEVEEDDSDLAVEWGLDLRRMLWNVEAWLCLKGAAYVLKHSQGDTIETLQVLNANSMRVKAWDEQGVPTAFEQRVGQTRRTFPAEEIVYWRTFDPSDDVREGIAPGQVGQRPGALIDAINKFAGAFFENGAIPAVLLTTEGAVPQVEKERIQSAWAKMFQGVRRAFKTAVLERGLTPTVVGQPVADLAMPDLERSKREQILAAHGLPPGLAEAKTNRAERDALKAEAYEECYIPECETWIEPVLNEQLFNALGLRVSFQYGQIEVLQARELEKAEASAFTVSIMKGAYDSNVVSLDEYRSWIQQVGQWSNMPPLEENFEPEERTPPQLQPFTGEQEQDDDGGGEGEPASVDERIENRLPKSAAPKAGAPPRWGDHRISLRRSDAGVTKRSNAAR